MVSLGSFKISFPVFATVLIFFIAGLLSIALKARHSIGSVSHPVETGLLIFRTHSYEECLPQVLRSHTYEKRRGGGLQTTSLSALSTPVLSYNDSHRLCRPFAALKSSTSLST